jgi:hypothetical protein
VLKLQLKLQLTTTGRGPWAGQFVAAGWFSISDHLKVLLKDLRPQPSSVLLIALAGSHKFVVAWPVVIRS